MAYDTAVHPACDHANDIIGLCKAMHEDSVTKVSATLLVFGTCRYCLCGPASTCRTLATTACAVPQCGLQAERDFNDLVESVEAMQLGTGLNDGGQISS